VVIAIVAILAALLLPALARVKERASVAQCLNNLHQMGIAIKLYTGDYASRYPTVPDLAYRSYRLGGGDPDPHLSAQPPWSLEGATNRPLWPYTHSRKLYCCPADRGMDFSPWMQLYTSTYETIGTSYKYNETPWCPTLVPEKNPSGGANYNTKSFGIAGKREDWIRYPARYILVHESPATPYPPDSASGQKWEWFFWHYARGPSTVSGLSVSTVFQVRDRSISPVLFADGHAVNCDFTQAIRSSPSYPAEPQPQWYWYEPAR
jgi:prepilin-type processing-associated H-X9-DG protein